MKNRKMHPMVAFCSACKKAYLLKNYVIQRSEATKNPFLKTSLFLLFSENKEHFGERIATPVCALARNDEVFDSLHKMRPMGAFCFCRGMRDGLRYPGQEKNEKNSRWHDNTGKFFAIRLIQVLVKMVENHFIAPKARQELYETGFCGFSIKNCKIGSAIGDAFLIEMKHFYQEIVSDCRKRENIVENGADFRYNVSVNCQEEKDNADI